MADLASLPLAACPMPGERHPELPNIDPDSTRTSHVVWNEPVVPVAPVGFMLMGDVEFRQVVLYRQRVRGPAPFTGRPFMYEWDALVDDAGRAIAGEARIVYLPPTDDPRTWPDDEWDW